MHKAGSPDKNRFLDKQNRVNLALAVSLASLLSIAGCLAFENENPKDNTTEGVYQPEIADNFNQANICTKYVVTKSTNNQGVTPAIPESVAFC